MTAKEGFLVSTGRDTLTSNDSYSNCVFENISPLLAKEGTL
jgi:hypothetical protein